MIHSSIIFTASLIFPIFKPFSSNISSTFPGMPRHINEIAWEAKYFCKTYWDGEFHPGFTPNFENVCIWLGAPENEPPRVVLEEECIKNITKAKLEIISIEIIANEITIFFFLVKFVFASCFQKGETVMANT